MGYEDVLFPLKPEGDGAAKLEETIKAEEASKKEAEEKSKAEEAAKLEETRRKADEALKPKEEKVKEKEKKEEPEEEEEEEDDDLAILDEIDKLWGAKIEVDYGKVDPLSAEGLYLREQAVERIGMNKLEEAIKAEHPRLYQAILMERQGIDPSELFSDDFVDYAKIKLEKEETMLKDVYSVLLSQKGNDQEEIEDAIKGALDKGGVDKLYERTEKLLKQAVKEQAEELKAEEQRAEKAQKVKEKDIKEFTENINNIISKGEINNFTIPEKDRAAFEKDFKNKLFYQDGKFFLKEEVKAEDLKNRMQAEFFKYRKGDIKDIALKEGKTEQVNRLRRRVGGNEKQQPTKEEQKPKEISLRDLAFQ